VISKRTALAGAIPLCVLFASGCGTAATTPPELTPSTSASAQAVVPNGSPTAVPTALFDVSPADQRVGGVTLSLAFEPPRHMVDQTAAFNAPNVDPLRPTPSVPDGVSKGSVVMSDMLKVTNNMDPNQLVPADSAQSIIRHVVVQIRAGDSSQPVPYLGVTMDILLDGHPVGFGQAVVPMLPQEASAPTLYYGNNVRLAQRGLYQVFIRLSRNLLLGSDQPQAAQFNVQVR
jgi:hypothetical protein